MGVEKGGGLKVTGGVGGLRKMERREGGGRGVFLTGCICIPSHISLLRLYLVKNQ